MEARTPASPDGLPPLGELIADDPFCRHPSRLGLRQGCRRPPPNKLIMLTWYDEAPWRS